MISLVARGLVSTNTPNDIPSLIVGIAVFGLALLGLRWYDRRHKNEDK